MDETRIDAAPTPAHVFAYRAFRSVFVTSPESSPIRPQITPYDDKENTRFADLRYPKPITSPPNTKRKSAGKDLLSLTPKRQKTVAISPTKSILKNPNAPTPRRLGLRDTNVTFKDIRKSASPDLAQRLTVMSIKPQSSGWRVTSEPLVHRTTIAEEEEAPPKAQRSITISTSVRGPQSQSIEQEQEHAAMVADIVRNPAFDVNDYVVKTEKELRRFAAYGKKWKKYAQKQDLEVERLKGLLEEVQKENDRLRRRIACEEKEAKSSTAVEAVIVREADKLPKKRPFLVSKDSQDVEPVRKSKDKRKNDAFEMPDAKLAMVTALDLPKDIRAETNDARRSQRFDNLDLRSSHAKAETSTISSVRKPLKGTKSPAQQATEILPRSISAPTAPSSNAVRITSMTSNRQAAARERLRLKNEERKASMGLSLAPLDPAFAAEKSVVNAVPSIPSIDESELDWADLAH